MPRLSQRALASLALLFNLPFAFFQLQRTAYDTYSHVFFADHYRQAWWSLWEPRWYLGFSMASYPPLVHQLIALLSWPIEALLWYFAPMWPAYPGGFRVLSEEAAFGLLLLAVLAVFPLAVRAFAGVFVGPRAAALAGLFAVAVPAVSLAAWSFGQLPTLLATATVLLALARGAAWARTGRRLWLVQAVALAGVAGAAHHGVFLFVPFAGAAVAARVLAERGPERWTRAARLAVWAGLAGALVAAVLWPFLGWSRGQALQTAIEHASRDNLLTNLAAAWYFFWPMYGPLLLMLPAMVALAWRTRRRWPLAALIGGLFVLGLGGTTPLPGLLFGAGWVWLTYDRFALWAALALLPVAGAVALRWWQRGRRRWVYGFFAALLAWSAAAGWHARLSQSQPAAIDLGPLVTFLDAPAQQPYRYFTFGFGDQLARLAALTRNGTPDGNYHTARQLPELRRSGLGALDGAVWNWQGLGALRPFVEQPQRYGVRWAFVAHPGYRALLAATGWHYRFMVGAVEAWEFPGVPARHMAEPEWATGPAAVWWGSAPLVVLALALLALAAERPRPKLTRATARRLVAGARQAAWGLAVALLLFWWYHAYWQGSTPRVFFLYQSVVVFASDLAALAAIGLWLVERRLTGAPVRWGPRAIGLAGLALAAAVVLSVFASDGQPSAVAFAAHVGLLAAWYLLCVNAAPPAAMAGRLWGTLLLVEALVVVGQALVQHNAWLGTLGLAWPPLVRPALGGAPVIQNAAGDLWLRVYGTLPHPNVLAGALLVLLAGVSERCLVTGRRWWLALAGAAGAALLLSFSRAAWVAAGAVALLGLLWSWRYAPAAGRRWRQVVLAAGLAALVAAAPLLPWLAARVNVGATATSVEARSVFERVSLTRDSLAVIAAHPLLGVGAGQFAAANWARGDPAAQSEPVHNVLLLITAETGLGGGAAAVALGLAVGARQWQRRRRAGRTEAVWGLALLGLLVTGLFDHYWWSLAPMRILFVTGLGVWAGASGAQEAGVGEVALDARGEALGGLEPHAHVVGVEERV